MSLGLSNWNFKSQTPTQDTQFRPFQESAAKFQTQKAFDRKFTDEPRSFMRAEVPSFDTLEKSIRGFSSSRIRDDLNLQKIRAPSKTTLYSPKKLSGIKQKYSTETNTRIGTIGTGTSNNTSMMFSRPSVSNINNNISNRTSARLSTPSRLESSFSKLGTTTTGSTSGLLNFFDNDRYLSKGSRKYHIIMT